MVKFPYIFIIILISIIKCDNEFITEEKPNYLKFPFNTKLNSIPNKKLNHTYNETNFFNDFFNNTIILNMSIATPEQNVSIILDPNEKCFTFKRDKELLEYNNININNTYYTKLLPYNKNISKSAKRGGTSYIGYSYIELYEMEDAFYLYKFSDIKNKTSDIIDTKTSLRFLYGNNRNEEEIVFGKIGLNMNSNGESSCPRFIYSLGIKYLIKNYIWHFDFSSRFKGYFYLGPEPHLYNKENYLYKNNEYIKINTILSERGNLQWELLFDKIKFKNFSNNYVFELKQKRVKIDFNLGLIIGTFEYQQIIEQNYFNNLINQNICKKTLVQNLIDKTKYYIYTCNERFKQYIYKTIRLSYYDIFPEIEFLHIDLNNPLNLYRFDLFEQICGNYYFLIIFDAETNNSIWKVGQTFLKRNKMIFDYESKTIGFYDKNNRNNRNVDEDYTNEKKVLNSTNTNGDNKEKNNEILKYFIQYLIFFIVIIITFYLGMKIKESRKKRANELKDDDYEYSSHNSDINSDTKINQKIELNKMGV